MRSQEKLWLQCPLSAWSSALGTASKQTRWRTMALRRILLSHIQHSECSGSDSAFHYPHTHPYAHPGGLGHGKIKHSSHQKDQFYAQRNGYVETRSQRQFQVCLQGQGHSHSAVQAHVHGGHGYDKTSAYQSNLHTQGHGCDEIVAEQHQQLEMQARQHLKMFVQARDHGYTEAIAHQKGRVHVQVQSHQYATLPGQQQDQTLHANGETSAPLQRQREEPVAIRPLPKRLLPIPVPRRSFSTNPRPMHVQNPIPVADTIKLTDLEFRIFNTLKAFLLHYDFKTQPRVAGGWVRDKLLGRQCGDIDIALDDMLGRTFCRKLSSYCRMVGLEITGFGVIKSNPTQAKHLEVAKMDILGVTIDFVNLRAHDYTESSCSPFTMILVRL